MNTAGQEAPALGVVVVITGEDPKQCATWEDALQHVGDHAAAGDPKHVSMFTLYWGDPE